jgi:hypothetical protein
MTCQKRRDDVEAAGSRYCGNSLDETCLRAGRHPALRWPESAGWRLSGTWEPGSDGNGKSQVEAHKPTVREYGYGVKGRNNP